MGPKRILKRRAASRTVQRKESGSESESEAETSVKKQRKNHDSHEWTLEIVEEIIKALMDVAICEDVRELKNHLILDCIWKEVGKRIKVDHLTLKNFWLYKLHMQLFSPTPIYRNDIKIKLIDLDLHTDEFKWEGGRIDWQKVVKYFDGFTKEYLQRNYINLIRYAKTMTSSQYLSVQIEFLRDIYKKHLIENETDEILLRLKYDKGKLEIIDVDH